MNILITSVGKRNYLVKYFQEALGGRGLVHAGNSHPLIPAMDIADACVVTPLVYEESYIPFLLNYCKKHEIGAILSVFDLDLPILAVHQEHFKEIGVRLVLASQEIISICNDKWNSYHFLKDHGFLTPKTYLYLKDFKKAVEAGEINYPVILKPRWGCGSRGIFEAENYEEVCLLRTVIERINRKSSLKFESQQDFANSVVIQEIFKGVEYNLNVINDLEANYCSTAVITKDTINQGSTESAHVVFDKQIEGFGEQIGRALWHIGNLDMDILRAGDQICVLDLNARFGGGYPFSNLAGLDLPKAIVAWLMDLPIQDEWLRVDQEIMASIALQPIIIKGTC
jgi:carbamoyl-phosphate synthase large subunit